MVGNWNVEPLLRVHNLTYPSGSSLLLTSDQITAVASTYTQHRKMMTNIHAISGIRTHDHSDQAIKTYHRSLGRWDRPILRYEVQNFYERNVYISGVGLYIHTIYTTNILLFICNFLTIFSQ
jgi:hypothetical protein